MKKRILSIFLILAMVVCLLPMAVFADTEVASFNLLARDPRTGGHPTEVYSAPDESSYSVSWYTLHVYSVDTWWTYRDEYNVEHTIEKADFGTVVFQPETVYTCHAKILLNSGYSFPSPPELTWENEPAEIEDWDSAQPWRVIVKHTYPATAPKYKVEKVAVTGTEPLLGAHPDSTVECSIAEYYEVHHAEWTDGGGHLLSASDTFQAGETYTLTVFLSCEPAAKFTSELTADKCALNPDYFGNNGKNPAEVRVLGDGAMEMDFIWIIPYPIGFVALNAQEQAYGETPIMYTWADSEVAYRVQSTKWFDDTLHAFMDGTETLQEGHSYHMEIEVFPEKGNTLKTGWGANEATLNGVASYEINEYSDHILVRVAAPVKEATLISEADVTYASAVAVGLTADDYATVPAGADYDVLKAVWYDDADNDIYFFTFEDGKTYTLRITLEPNHGFAFADDAVFRLNGDAVTATADGRNRIIEKTYNLSSWNPTIITSETFDLTAGAPVAGDYSAEKATLKAAAQEAKIIIHEDGGKLYVDLDKDGTEDIYCGPHAETPSLDTLYLVDGRSFAGTATITVDATGLAYLEAEAAPSYIEELVLILPEPTWTVSFDADGGTGSMTPISVLKGDKLTLPECAFTAPEGKAFDKWDQGAPGEEIAVAADMTVKAIWKDKDAETWTVSFDADGGTGMMETVKVVKGEKLTLPECTFTAPEGKTFDKWDQGEPGVEIGVPSDMTVTAIWKDKGTWTVTFDANGGSGTMEPLTVEKGKTYVLPLCGFTAPEGKEFDTWDAGAPGAENGLTSDTTVKAIWKDKDDNTWTITFDAAGGKGTMEPVKLTKGEKFTLPECAFTAPAGMQFYAWSFGDPGYEVEVMNDITVQAVWMPLENPFDDVEPSDYYYDAVIWAYYTKPFITNGKVAPVFGEDGSLMTPGQFGPMDTVTRGQAVTFLWRAMGEPEPTNTDNPFVDVWETDYWFKAIMWAVEKGIVKGTDATHYTPYQTCSTAHMVTFLFRTLGIGEDGWFEEAGNWAKGLGLLDGMGLEVSRAVDCPRGSVATFLFRALVKD